MRFSKIKPGLDIGAYNEDKFRKEFEKAMKVGHIYGVPIKKGKRFRSAFTTEQVNYLEKEFRKYPYIGNARRKDVANVLDIPERAVKIWFQNRRMKEKKDVTNKEPESEKFTEVNESCSATQSKSNVSLPLLSTPTSQSEKKQVITSSESKCVYKNNFKDLASKEDAFSASTKEMSVIQINTASTTTAEVPSSSSKKFKTENNYEVLKKKLPTDPYSDHYQVPQMTTSRYVQYPGESNLSYPLYLSSPTAVPQDLSSKPMTQAQKTQPEQNNFELKYNPAEVPLYLKEYYAPPYIPPGSMIWKPINMIPIMTSAPIPASTGSTSQNPNMMKNNCNCDCHKPYMAPMMIHNNPHANVQYVVTTLPLQNSSPKF